MVVLGDGDGKEEKKFSIIGRQLKCAQLRKA